MFKKNYFNVAVTFLLMLLFTACSKINEDDEKYVGEWQFCYTNDDPSSSFWKKEDVQSLTLTENGEFKLGDNKITSEWGKGKGFPIEYNLNIKKWSVLSPFANQIKNIESHIIEIEGIKVLEIVVNFSYQGFGAFDHSTNGVTITANQEYDGFVKYYYVKTNNENEKIKNYFDEQNYKKQFDELNKLLNDKDNIEDIVLDGYSLRSLINADQSVKDKWKNVINYGIKTARANESHLKLLKIITTGIIDEEKKQKFDDPLADAIDY